jgi:hypothetical protein
MIINVKGGREMNTKEQNKNKNVEKKNDETEPKQKTDASHTPTMLKLTDLPALSETSIQQAAEIDRIEFLKEFMSVDRLGTLEWFNMGFMLQNSGPNRLRCIHIYDDPVAMHCLASVAQTISFAGGILEVEPYTVVAPLYAGWKKLDREIQTPTKEARSPGMEVA